MSRPDTFPFSLTPSLMKMRYLENLEIYREVVLNGIFTASESVWIATADVKDLQVEEGRRYVSILEVFSKLCRKGVEIRILHSGIPSSPFRRDFRKYGLFRDRERNFNMKRCLRVHFKAILIDGKRLFIGSPNLTGAGIGAKGEKKRNFEIGIITENPDLIKDIRLLFLKIWEGEMCAGCGRRQICYVPLEQPE